MDLFSRHMNAACQQHGHGWVDSPQLANLLAMADPEAARKLPNGMELRHMRLERDVNEFVEAKNSGAVFSDYATAVGRLPANNAFENGHTERCKPAARNSDDCNLHPWVIQTKRELMERHKAPSDEVLRGKPLAERWQHIEDPPTKAHALSSIREYWESKNWWSNPPGKAAKRAKNIYEQGV